MQRGRRAERDQPEGQHLRPPERPDGVVHGELSHDGGCHQDRGHAACRGLARSPGQGPSRRERQQDAEAGDAQDDRDQKKADALGLVNGDMTVVCIHVRDFPSGPADRPRSAGVRGRSYRIGVADTVSSAEMPHRSAYDSNFIGCFLPLVWILLT